MSHNQQIIDYLLTGKKISVLTCYYELGFLALTPRIAELRQMGYPIQGQWTVSNNGKRYKAYYLLPSDIARLTRLPKQA